MSMLLGWVIFLFALCVSVMLHEFGHFATAKKFGMKVTQFFLGFGPTLWSTTRGGTEYGVKAIPAGGFVKITGMTSMDEVEAQDEPRSFRVKPAWQRVIVLVAGSFMHFLLAFVLLLAIPVGIGIANADTTTIGTVVRCVPASDISACPSGAHAGSPASRAGLKTGDKIVAFGGSPVRSWTGLVRDIRRYRPGSAVPVTVQRGSRRLRVALTLAGTRSGHHEIPFVGVAAGWVFQRTGPLRGVSYAGSMFGQAVTGTGDVIATLPSAFSHLFAKNRSATAAGQVSSVVGIGEITGDVVAANAGWQEKVTDVLLIIVSVNIFVGLFNLLPLLPLDGGHVAVVIYERLRAWLARIAGRPDPGLVDMTKLIPVSFSVFALLVGFALVVMLADIVNPINIH